MSDYLGMLAARYLNQAGSIRPEPVSIYQPPPPDWQLAGDSSRSDGVAADEPGLPISPAQPIAIDDGEGWPIAIDDGEGKPLLPSPSEVGQAGPLFPSPSGGGQGGGAFADAEPSPAQPSRRELEFVAQASPREPNVVAQPIGADDVDLALATGRGAVPGPGAPPSPPQPSTRDRDVLEHATGVETVSVRQAGAPPLPSPWKPVFPSPGGEASSIASPFMAASSAPSGGGQGGGEREVETLTQQPLEVVRSLAVEALPGPGQPVHPSPAPRVERAADPRGTSPTLIENKERGRLPLPSVVFSETAQPGSEPPLAALAPSRTPPGIAQGTIEPLPPRVAPTLALFQTSVPTLPSPGRGGEMTPAQGGRGIGVPRLPLQEMATVRGRDMNSDAEPIVEITIDEISIRAALPQPAPATPRRERLVHPPMSLEDYLRRRSGSVSR